MILLGSCVSLDITFLPEKLHRQGGFVFAVSGKLCNLIIVKEFWRGTPSKLAACITYFGIRLDVTNWGKSVVKGIDGIE